MRIDKNGQGITSVEDWGRLAGPKASNQWVEGRSAFELARAWVETNAPTMPPDVRALLNSHADTAALAVDVVWPEHPIAFDSRRGEPRNADLAFVGQAGRHRVAVTVEAKADEPFGSTVGETLTAAVARWTENERSGGVGRVLDLVESILPRPTDGGTQASALRYQLLTAVAGTLALAVSTRADIGVLVIHEFVTNKTRAELHAKNHADYQAFLARLSPSLAGGDRAALVGPIVVPGAPLFAGPVPLFIGTLSTRVGQ